MNFEQFLDYKQKYPTHSRRLFILYLYTLFPSACTQSSWFIQDYSHP